MRYVYRIGKSCVLFFRVEALLLGRHDVFVAQFGMTAIVVILLDSVFELAWHRFAASLNGCARDVFLLRPGMREMTPSPSLLKDHYLSNSHPLLSGFFFGNLVLGLKRFPLSSLPLGFLDRSPPASILRTCASVLSPPGSVF